MAQSLLERIGKKVFGKVVEAAKVPEKEQKTLRRMTAGRTSMMTPEEVAEQQRRLKAAKTKTTRTGHTTSTTPEGASYAYDHRKDRRSPRGRWTAGF